MIEVSNKLFLLSYSLEGNVLTWGPGVLSCSASSSVNQTQGYTHLLLDIDTSSGEPKWVPSTGPQAFIALPVKDDGEFSVERDDLLEAGPLSALSRGVTMKQILAEGAGHSYIAGPIAKERLSKLLTTRNAPLLTVPLLAKVSHEHNADDNVKHVLGGSPVTPLAGFINGPVAPHYYVIAGTGKYNLDGTKYEEPAAPVAPAPAPAPVAPAPANGTPAPEEAMEKAADTKGDISAVKSITESTNESMGALKKNIQGVLGKNASGTPRDILASQITKKLLK